MLNKNTKKQYRHQNVKKYQKAIKMLARKKNSHLYILVQ